MYTNKVVIQPLDDFHNVSDGNSTSSNSNSNNISYKTAHLETELYNKIADRAKKRNTNLRRYLNDMIAAMVEREEMLSRMEPFLTIVGTQQSSMFIKDEKTGKTAEVILTKNDKDNKISIHCNLDDSDSCVHVAFGRASNELGELIPKGIDTGSDTDAESKLFD